MRAGPPRGRVWLFRLVLLILPALVFFGLLEAGLRLAGYGYPTRFLVPIESADAYTTNPAFGMRFFPPALARTPQPCRLAARKDANAYRIFLLGESAAQGTPDPAFGVSRVLEAMLEERFPGTRFEVVNAAMTAINSHALLPIARDCARHDPDLFILYIGNNEVIGPYGAGTVFANFSSHLGPIRATVALKATRTGQWLSALGRRLRPAGAGPRRWDAMKMFLENPVAADDPRLARVYAHFRANLGDICHAAEGAGARVLLCTIGTNLEDCPPFSSVHGRALGAAEAARWEERLARGIERDAAGDPVAAVAAFREAAAIDDGFAELHFRMARSLAALGEHAEAERHYILARERDALRFRADEPINRAIREIAREERGRGVILVDADSAFVESPRTGHRVPGREHFFEHVHMNWEGTHLLAALLFDRVVETLPESIRRRAAGGGGGEGEGMSRTVSAPSAERCAELLALTPRDRFSIAYQIDAMMNNAPFTTQIDHALARAERRAELDSLRAELTPESRRASYEAYRAAIARRPEDLYFREAAAEFLCDAGEYAQGVEAWRALLALCPGVAKWRLELGKALAQTNRLEEALAIFRETVKDPPPTAEAHNMLGVALERAGRIDEALRAYRRAEALDPRAAEPAYNLGLALARRGETREAMAHFARALEADSAFVDAYLGMAAIDEQEGRPEEAIARYRDALRADPSALQVVHALVGALGRQGRVAEALAEMRAFVQANPGLPAAHYGLGVLLADVGRDDAGAERHLREAVRLAGDWVPALGGLSEFIAERATPGSPEAAEAITLGERAARATGGADPRTLQALAAAYAADGQLERAAQLAQRGAEIARQAGDAPLAGSLEQRAALYRQGQRRAPRGRP